MNFPRSWRKMRCQAGRELECVPPRKIVPLSASRILTGTSRRCKTLNECMYVIAQMNPFVRDMPYSAAHPIGCANAAVKY